jgi:pentatricopeptide repeat protein
MNEKTLELFQQLQPEEMIADGFTFVQLLDACVSLRALEEGRHIHMQIIEWGCESDACVGSSLVDMYSKCGSIEDAPRVFNRMPECNVVAWSAMILGHVKSGQGQKELELSHQMEQQGETCHLCGSADCLCQSSSPGRQQACS